MSDKIKLELSADEARAIDAALDGGDLGGMYDAYESGSQKLIDALRQHAEDANPLRTPWSIEKVNGVVGLWYVRDCDRLIMTSRLPKEKAEAIAELPDLRSALEGAREWASEMERERGAARAMAAAADDYARQRDVARADALEWYERAEDEEQRAEKAEAEVRRLEVEVRAEEQSANTLRRQLDHMAVDLDRVTAERDACRAAMEACCPDRLWNNANSATWDRARRLYCDARDLLRRGESGEPSETSPGEGLYITVDGLRIGAAQIRWYRDQIEIMRATLRQYADERNWRKTDDDCPDWWNHPDPAYTDKGPAMAQEALAKADGDHPDMDLLHKFARGTGGRRTGALMRAGYLRAEVTSAGCEALAKVKGGGDGE